MKTTLRLVALLSLIWLAGCRSKSPVTPVNAMEPAPTAPVSATALEVTYLANEGFMIAGGGKKVLIDALFGEGLKGYAVVSSTQRALLEGARAPFADVDVVCATHFHGDHFNAEPVLAHLTNNPQAFFFSTPQAADKLRATGKFDAVKARVIAALPQEGERLHTGHRGVGVQLLNIHHGRTRPVENLGFLIELAGKRILHIGDSEAEPAVFQKYEISQARIDVAFLPTWYFENDEFKRAVREQMQPRHIVVMHVPPDTAFSRLRDGDFQKKWAQIKAEFPNAVYLAQELDKKVFD